jgi:exopolysaccharide production protein ExoY
VSELSKLSADLAAFDPPVHDDSQLAVLLGAVGVQETASPARSIAAKSKPAKLALVGSKRRGLMGGPLTARADADIVPSSDAVDSAPSSRPIGGFAKRAVDVVISLSALILLSPLLLIVALLIRATMGRPVLFSHRRLGLHGRPFACLKFRTMVSDADAALRLHLISNPEARLEWKASQKLQRDPRVTSLGRLLRRSSIDELPQLLNVLMGQMSCVGPRPIVDDEVARYGDYWTDYMGARPGLTGPWQVSGRNRLTYERRVALDRHYVRRWSMWRDAWLLIQTIPAVMRPDDTA